MNDLFLLLGLLVLAMGALFAIGWLSITLARVLVNLAFLYFPAIHNKALEDDSGRFLVIPIASVKTKIGRRALSTLTYQSDVVGYERKPTVNFRGPKGEFIATKRHANKSK